MPAVSKQQQKFFGLVLAYKRGEVKDVSADVKKAADSMTLKDIEKYASTKHKGLPMKKEQLMEQGLYELFGLFSKKPAYQTSSPARLGAAKVYTDADIASAGAKLGLSDYMTKSSYVGDVYKNITKTDANIEKAPVSPSDVGALMQFVANRYNFSTPPQALRNMQKTALKAK